jgi:signal transduction histidine kinase
VHERRYGIVTASRSDATSLSVATRGGGCDTRHNVFSGRRASRRLDGSAWLFAGLVLLTVVPSACVLWFMSEAVRVESTAARQRVVEAYRGQLRLVRSRLDGVWRTQAMHLDCHGDTATCFARLVNDGIAEGAVFIDPDGSVTFPSSNPRTVANELERRSHLFGKGSGELSGTPPASVIDAMAQRVNDYAITMPPAERLALMDRLRTVAPNVWLPTQAALHLSFDLLDAERPAAVPDVVRKTAMPDIWALTSADQQVIGLYRTGRIEAMMHDVLHEISPAGIVFIAYPPDEPADAEAVAAGPWLPGWQLSFVPLDSSRMNDAIRQRRAVYLSVAVMGVALILGVGAAAGGGLRRHLRLARLKTDLVAAASHELRTPVASMRVLVEGLLADATFDPVKTREYLHLLARENARLGRQIESFLTFSRLDGHRYRFALVPVAASAIVEAALDAIRDRLPADATLRVDMASSLPLVRGDPEMLTIALTNLLDNAVKYTGDDKRIGLRVLQDRDHIGFAVSDNGIGIAPAERRRIFRRFYQVDQRLSRETGGVGLGLSIVSLIVRGHQGALDVTSGLGTGSTFVMRLPIVKEAR